MSSPNQRVRGEISFRVAESESRPELESVGVETGVGVAVGAGVGNIWLIPTPARSRRLPPVNIPLLWPNGYPSFREH